MGLCGHGDKDVGEGWVVWGGWRRGGGVGREGWEGVWVGGRHVKSDVYDAMLYKTS